MSEERTSAGSARVISGAEAQPWSMPSVGHGGGPLTAGRLESIEEEARKSGHEAGYAAGLEAGRAEIERRARQLDEVLASFAKPLEHLDGEIEQELVELVMAIARRLVRRELKASPGEIIGVVRDSIAALPIGERQVTVQLHPDDAVLVREAFGGRDNGPACRILEDPSLGRGGARIATDISVIDATLETRINRVFDRLLGGERQTDEGEGE